MAAARANHTATLLPNGKVLVAGGRNGSSVNQGIASAELYDPVSGTWTTTGTMTWKRQRHTATLLPNGKVLVTGGWSGVLYPTRAELYDPAAGIWVTMWALNTPREIHTATLLTDGNVLIAGGFGPPSGDLSSAQLYDVGLGFDTSWRPQIGTVTSPLSPNASLILSGSGFRGLSGASSGNSQDSPTDYPLVQLRSLQNGQTVFLAPDPASSWSATSFTSTPVTTVPPGYALVTVFVNGIPSTSATLKTKITPVITWASPVDIVYGTPLGGSQLNALGNVPGTFTYIPATGAMLGAGSGQTLLATFTPDDVANYTSTSATVHINVLRATPNVTTWPAASAITYGQTLASSTLSGGSATPAGTFVFTAASTVPDVGISAQSVTFTPTDLANYDRVTGIVNISVSTGPTLSHVDPLSLATEELGFQIDYAALHTDGQNLIQFVVNSISDDGVLMKNGTNVLSGTTFGPGEQLVWVAYPHLSASDPATYEPFTIVASDGAATSAPSVPVQITVAKPACAINTQWPSACTLAQTLDAASGLMVSEVYQALNELDESRWYRFKVYPGSKIIAILSQLPDDYDVFLFKDIMQSYLELADPNYSVTQEKLANFGAEAAPTAFSPTAFSPTAFSPTAFSPTAFSPTAFSPTAFSPTAFSPTAFSPTAFSPTAFSPTAFSPTAFSPTAFSPAVFSPTAFSPTAFSPTAFSPTAFSPTAFSGAQVRSLVGLSAFPGTADEGIYLNAWDNSGDFYLCVRGRNGAWKVGVPFRLQVFVEQGACGAIAAAPLPEGKTRIQATAGPSRTLILLDSWRMLNPCPNLIGPSPAEVQKMIAALNVFAALPEIQGVVVDLGADTWLRALHQWSDDPKVVTCPYARNVVANAIRQIVLDYRNLRPAIENIVIVGNDNIIPFLRYADVAGIGNENEYVAPFQKETSGEAALRHGMVLSQEAYGSQCGLSIHGSTFPVADIPVGRLVETPDDIISVLNSYPAGGLLKAPSSSLVVGYDFLADAAAAIKGELVKAIGSQSGTVFHDELIASRDTSPTNGWTATQLMDSLLLRRHDLLFLAGHYDGGRALAADWKTCLSASQLVGAPVDLQNAIVFGAGCHVGFNFVNEFDVVDQTPEPDWAQAFASKGVAAFIGGTGYQYGDTDFIEYNERLYLEFAKQLCTGSASTPVSIGKALTTAKRRYLEGTPVPREIHEKTILEVALYGLPMIKVAMPHPANYNTSHPSIFTAAPASFAGGTPGAVLGLQYRDESFTPSAPPETDVLLTVYPDDQLHTTDLHATYLTGEAGQVLSNPSEPILPLFIRDGTRPNALLRGVVFRGGTYVDKADVRPFTGAPAYDIRGVHVPFQSDYFYPIQPWSVNYYGAACGGKDQTLLYLFPVQHLSEGPQSDLAIRRTFTRMDLRLYCSGNTLTYAGTDGTQSWQNTPALAAPPTVANVTDAVDAGTVNFKVRVTGDPPSGMQEVWVTYTAATPGKSWYGDWASVQLEQHVTHTNDPDSTLWEGSLALPADITASDIRYLVQAVNGVGLVTMDSKRGAYHVPGQQPAVATALTIPSDPGSGAYGTEVRLSATLVLPAGASLDGHCIQFGIGGQRCQALTKNVNGASVASATIRLLGQPGDYTLQAGFAGNATYAPSSASMAFRINQQDTQLSLQTVPQRGTPFDVVAVLKDAARQPLNEKQVCFLVTDITGNLLEYIIRPTDPTGQAVLGALRLPAGRYKVKAYFGGPVPAYDLAAPVNLTDPCYQYCDSDDSQLITLEYANPIACKIDYVGDSVIPLGSDLHMAAKVTALTPLTQGDYSCATMHCAVSTEDGQQLTDFAAPVMADGRSYAALGGLGTGVYRIDLELLGGVFQATKVLVLVAVYDPSAGFVTGGGWFNSPAGAYVSNSLLTGKAQFAFESKYLKSGKLPVGNTSFKFQVANLDFRSTTYDWLVVSGAKAQYKGAGTINAAGNFGFILTAIDGALQNQNGLDKLRMKIWNLSTGALVYDNFRGAADTADPTTSLGGGSIVIHK
jgi:hypothetical protein